MSGSAAGWTALCRRIGAAFGLPASVPSGRTAEVRVWWTAAVPSQPAAESPSTAAALPHAFTGTLTGTLTWLPPSTEALPEVLPPAPPVSAKAAPEKAAPAVTKVAAIMAVFAVQ
jgi:hypothetical protein